MQETADEISRLARQRMALVKERHDLQKIASFVGQYFDTLRRRVREARRRSRIATQRHVTRSRYVPVVRRRKASFDGYLEGVREQKITVRNVYAAERLQRGEQKRSKAKVDADATRKAVRCACLTRRAH